MGRRWCIRSRAPRLWLSLPDDAPAGRGTVVPEALRDEVARWLAVGAMDAFERGALGDARRAIGAGSADGDVLAALRAGALVAWGQGRRVEPAGAGVERPPQGPSSEPAAGSSDTWISIELIDESDAPVSGVAWRVVLPEGGVREGTLPRTGVAHLTGITPGVCRVSFPGLDGEAWCVVGGAAPSLSHDAGESVAVRQGETTESLAYARGLFWETVWDHPENAPLRALGRGPNVLLPGDPLFLPRRVAREESCATTRLHRFRRRGVPTTLEVRCLDLEGEPYAGEPFRLVAGGFERVGALDGDGWLRCWLPLEVRRLELFVGEDGALERYDLLVGHLDPLDASSGVCDRLRNLGYYSGPSVTDEDRRLRDAVRWFRRDAGLDPGDAVDDTLRAALRRGHHA